MRNFFIKSEINCNENNEVIYNSYLHSKYYKCLYYQKRYTIFGLISFKIDKQIYEAIDGGAFSNHDYPDPFFPLLFLNREEMYSWIERYKTIDLLKKYFKHNKKYIINTIRRQKKMKRFLTKNGKR